VILISDPPLIVFPRRRRSSWYSTLILGDSSYCAAARPRLSRIEVAPLLFPLSIKSIRQRRLKAEDLVRLCGPDNPMLGSRLDSPSRPPCGSVASFRHAVELFPSRMTMLMLTLISKGKRNPYIGSFFFPYFALYSTLFTGLLYLSLSQTTTTTTTQVIPSHLVATHPVLSFMYRRLSHD
jgi:hypothetical protein